MKFRKKPIVIEAFQYQNESDSSLLPNWAFTIEGGIENYHLVIDTLEGRMKAYPGDWIIKGVKGELYPCKPDIFEATYERVEE